MKDKFQERVRVRNIIDELNTRYNPECDIAPNAPPVTYTDMKLTAAVESLLLIVADLQSQIDQIKRMQSWH